MVVITRADLSQGYQSQQSCHSIVDFAHEFPIDFQYWKKTSNSIICLQVNNEDELLKLYNKLYNLTNIVKFNEPDINDELTSICLYADSSIRKKLSYLPLLGKKTKTLEKVVSDMLDTQQTDTQNVLEHGISVNNKFNQLITDDSTFRLPKWFIENKEFILDNLHNVEDIKEYQILHDCGTILSYNRLRW